MNPIWLLVGITAIAGVGGTGLGGAIACMFRKDSDKTVAELLVKEGDDVKELQRMLIQLDYDLGKWGADGDFGDATEMAVRKFQKEHDCDVDGQVGPETLAALNAVFNAQGDEGETVPDAKKVRIDGGQCYVRSAPNTSGKILGVAKEGTVLVYQGQTSVNGWHLVIFENQNGWVSGKYGKLEV